MCSSQPTSQETVSSGADNHIIWVRPAQPGHASNAAAAAADDDGDEDNTDAAFPRLTNKRRPVCVCYYMGY